jgi:hypothetical protein
MQHLVFSSVMEAAETGCFQPSKRTHKEVPISHRNVIRTAALVAEFLAIFAFTVTAEPGMPIPQDESNARLLDPHSLLDILFFPLRIQELENKKSDLPFRAGR